MLLLLLSGSASDNQTTPGRLGGYSWEELAGAELVWLLEIELAGDVYRFATEPVLLVASTDGVPTALFYESGLAEAEFEIKAEPFGEGDVEPTASLELLFERAGKGPAELLINAQDPLGGKAELALIRKGDSWEERDVVFSGVVNRLEHTTRGAPITLDLVSPFVSDSRTIPPDGYAIEGDRWTGADGTVLGEVYPVCFGYPGNKNGDFDPTIITNQTAPGIPGLLVSDTGKCVICAFPTEVGQNAGLVSVYNKTTGALFNANAALEDARVGTNPLGRALDSSLCTTVSWSDTSFPTDDGDEIWISYQDISTFGGGILREDESGPLRGAGEIIAWIMERSNVNFDKDGSKQAIERLNDFRLDFFWNTYRPAWSVLVEDLAPYLPVGWELGPRGVRLLFWDAWADRADATFEVNPSTFGGRRASPVQRSPVSEIENEIELGYWLSGEGETLLTMTIGGQRARENNDHPYYLLHPIASASATRYGNKPSGRIDCPCIQDPGTAYRSAEYLLRTRAASFRTVRYELPQQYQSIGTGDVGVINDPEAGLSDVLVIAHNIVRTTGDTVIEFRELPDWIRTHAGLSRA